MPKVSVLIPSFNAAHFLSISIESALSQSYQDFEIIIVDDGSNDNTKEIVQSYIAKHPNKIHYFWQKNQGVSIARNRCIQQSQGEYLAWLDADDKWLPCRLEEGVRILDSDTSVGLVHGNLTYDETKNNENTVMKRNTKLLNGFIFDNIFLRKADISCSTVLFRRSCCENVGMFDVNLSKLGCEDRDLWLRIAKKYKIKHVNKILTYYRRTPQGMSNNQEKMLEARLYIIDKYCPINDKSKHGLRNKALSKIFRDRGDGFLSQRNYINSREEYLKAIGYHPLAFWPWFNLIKTFINLKKNV